MRDHCSEWVRPAAPVVVLHRAAPTPEAWRAHDGLHRLPAGRRRPTSRSAAAATPSSRRDWRRGGAVALARADGRARARRRAPAAGASPQPAPVLALSQPEFAAAVRRALRDLHRPDALAAQPARPHARACARARATRRRAARCARCCEEAVGRAHAPIRATSKLLRALDRTYLRPAPTQEAAAELLGLPFSTYRGHLTRGLERVVDLALAARALRRRIGSDSSRNSAGTRLAARQRRRRILCASPGDQEVARCDGSANTQS